MGHISATAEVSKFKLVTRLGFRDRDWHAKTLFKIEYRFEIGDYRKIFMPIQEPFGSVLGDIGDSCAACSMHTTCDVLHQMNKSLDSHDASVMEEPAAKYDVFGILRDSAGQRHDSPKETKFPQTTSGMIGWRIGKPGSRLELFGSHARPIGDIYKTLRWPPGCSS